MTDTSHLLGLPYLQPSQAQKHVTHNEALQQLDAVVQLSVDELSVTTPPETPTAGDRYLVGETATGVWASHDTEVAVYTESGWQFYPPAPGWVVYLRNTAGFAAFDGTEWVVLSAPDSAMLGINATADAQTRLAVAATGALFTHDGSDHRLKINKNGVGDTASLLFQTDFNGRAEMGLAGEDAFSVKVSADGVNWVTAMRFDPATAAVSGAAIQQDADDSTAGRLMLAEHGVLRSEIVGTVTQAAGLPTGAIIERSTSAAGHVVKWADGTIMMSRTVTVDINSASSQVFSYPDVIATVLGGGFIGAKSNEASGTGSVPRRQAMANLTVWTDTDDWEIRLHESVAADTLEVTLTVFGLWF
jgi:uncharacterized protein DUF2793